MIGGVATIVTFHAHPDDESIATGGTMARYAAEGHRVVLVVATKGEHGEVDDEFLDDGEELWQRREQETHESARILGTQRVEFLGYVDSGMMGTPENDAPGSFWRADLDEAAERLARILREEAADVLLIYDENGNYGHPDHIQVHRVGSRAAELAGTPRVFQATQNRDHIKRLMKLMEPPPEMEDPPDEEFLDTLGLPEERITHRIDVRDFADVKRRSMAAHASQIGENSFFLQMPQLEFVESFGWEWYVDHHAPTRDGDFGDDLLA